MWGCSAKEVHIFFECCGPFYLPLRFGCKTNYFTFQVFAICHIVREVVSEWGVLCKRNTNPACAGQGKITVCGFCPFALLTSCPFALLSLPLPLPFLSRSVNFSRLLREDIFCYCFHISVRVQVPSTLLMFLLPAQMTTMTFSPW